MEALYAVLTTSYNEILKVSSEVEWKTRGMDILTLHSYLTMRQSQPHLRDYGTIKMMMTAQIDSQTKEDKFDQILEHFNDMSWESFYLMMYAVTRDIVNHLDEERGKKLAVQLTELLTYFTTMRYVTDQGELDIVQSMGRKMDAMQKGDAVWQEIK